MLKCIVKLTLPKPAPKPTQVFTLGAFGALGEHRQDMRESWTTLRRHSHMESLLMLRDVKNILGKQGLELGFKKE